MAIFRRSKIRSRKTIRPLRTFKIQGIEGSKQRVLLESFLTSQRVNTSIPGTTNAFKTYESQVSETYNKYNGASDFGNAQARAVIDYRTAFISGEGVSVSTPNEATAEWIERFLDQNRLKGETFLNAIKGTEMAGHGIMLMRPRLQPDDSLYVQVVRIPYSEKRPFRPIYTDPFIKDELARIEFKVNGVWTAATINNFIYVRTGGDDQDSCGPTTKVGVVLTDLENYDRAVRDMRRNNHVFARITPVFETTSAAETQALLKFINDTKWTIGKAFIGTAKFSYETPGEGAHKNLESELTTEIKTISATTGVPVHWLGFVDLMSNRATAETLYEVIKNATIAERVAWEAAMYDLLIKAQELYIDSGGTDLPALDREIQVTLPLIDFSQFLERVKALSLAYHDEAISMDDYRGQLPGIDPLDTAKAVEKEKEEAMERLVKSGLTTIPNDEDEDEEGDEEDE